MKGLAPLGLVYATSTDSRSQAIRDMLRTRHRRVVDLGLIKPVTLSMVVENARSNKERALINKSSS